MTYDRLFLAAALIVFLATFIATMLYVRWRGYEPKGVMTNVKAWEAVVTTVASLLWLVVTLLYIFDGRSVVWFGRIAFLDNDVAKGLGIVLSTVGVLAGIAGEVALGEHFRVALPRENTKLITTGIYRYTRNPCVLGVDLFVLGTFLIAPSMLALVTVVLNSAGYHLKIRAEEGYLQQTYGAEYEAYCARTGRFLPRIRRRDAR
jgi:protein-S-isoprenylcysteine O-methyltransferase Ste14